MAEEKAEPQQAAEQEPLSKDEPQQPAYGSVRLGSRRYAPSLYDVASAGARLSFSWISPLVALGYRQTLEEGDLPDLPAVEKAAGVAALARQHWAEEQRVAAAAGSEPSLVGALTPIVRRDVQWAALAELIKVSLQFSGPVVTNIFVTYLDETQGAQCAGDGSASASELCAAREKDWTPWLCALAMLLLPVLQGIAKVHQTNLLTNVGIRLKTAMTALVFDKAVKLSAEGRAVCSKGEMTNLIATDAEKVMMSAPKFNLVWSAPVTTIVCLVLLSREIGVGAAFAGFAMLWVGFVALGLVFSFMGKLNKRKMLESDARVNLMSEILRGIKILKLYCWEEPMFDMVDVIRKREVLVLRKTIWLQALMQIVLLSAPSLMALVGFKVYVNGGGVATPATIFTALVLFELLRWALMNIPSIVIMLVDLKTAKARYGKYLHAPEVDTSMHLDPEGEAAVEVRGCDFSWGEQRALSAVSLSVARKLPQHRCHLVAFS